MLYGGERGRGGEGGREREREREKERDWETGGATRSYSGGEVT